MNDFNTIKFLTAIVTKEYTEYHSFARDRTVREIDHETKRGSLNVCAQVHACSSTNIASGLRSHAKSIRGMQLRRCMRCCIRKECWCTSRIADATWTSTNVRDIHIVGSSMRSVDFDGRGRARVSWTIW